MDVEGSRIWFTDLWNYSLVPYLLEAVREGLQVRAEHRYQLIFSQRNAKNLNVMKIFLTLILYHLTKLKQLKQGESRIFVARPR